MKKKNEKKGKFSFFWYMVCSVSGLIALIIVTFRPDSDAAKTLIDIMPILFYAYLATDFAFNGGVK